MQITLTTSQIDRAFNLAAARQFLKDAGVTEFGGDSIDTLTKPLTNRAILALQDGTLTPGERQPAVTVERRVLVTGGDCYNRPGHQIALVRTGDAVKVHADADDPDDATFHTTVADLKAAVAALESIA